MKGLWRWGKRLFVLLIGLALLLAAPVLRNELTCQGDAAPSAYTPILPLEHTRAEARTLMTYPEWHIVHAYDDYGQVISDGDPHDFAYFSAITGYWSSLCALTRASAAHGGVDAATKQLVYVIGTSFTLELLAKAAYEETLGRVATWIRGGNRAPLDDLSAAQARDYATFLQQVPWYKWDFDAGQSALAASSSGSLRDRERRAALGIENRVKAAYARAIGAAVAATGQDALTLRMVARGVDAAAHEGVTVITDGETQVLETPRYRALTHLLYDMALAGAEFVEIAGNDDILITAISSQPTHPRALHSFARQGYGDWRHLALIKVGDLAETLRRMEGEGLRLEHIHDY